MLWDYEEQANESESAVECVCMRNSFCLVTIHNGRDNCLVYTLTHTRTSQMMQLPPIEIGRLISRSMWIERGNYKTSLAFKQIQQTPSIVLLTAGWGEPESVRVRSRAAWGGRQVKQIQLQHVSMPNTKRAKLHRERAIAQQEISCCNMW